MDAKLYLEHHGYKNQMNAIKRKRLETDEDYNTRYQAWLNQLKEKVVNDIINTLIYNNDLGNI